MDTWGFCEGCQVVKTTCEAEEFRCENGVDECRRICGGIISNYIFTFYLSWYYFKQWELKIIDLRYFLSQKTGTQKFLMYQLQ